MATAEELLATVGNEENIIVIDSDLRTMTFPASVKNIGVENDKDVHKLNFMMPRYFGEYDLSIFNIRINYLNANGDGDMYAVTDPTVEEDAIYFTWLVGRHACLYKGAVTFIVCLKLADGEGDVAQEFNTTLASLPVLPGLETEPTILETDYDIIEQLLLTVQDTNGKIKAVLDSGMTAEELGNIAKEQKTLKSRMDEFASLPDGSTAGNAELTDIRVGADGTVYNNAGGAVRGQVSDLKSALTNQTVSIRKGYLEAKSSCILGGSTLWAASSDGHIMIPVAPGDTVAIYANGNQDSYYGVLTQYQTPKAADTVAYSSATGFTGRLETTKNTSDSYTMPLDAAYLAVNLGYSGLNFTPSKILINGVDVLTENLANVYEKIDDLKDEDDFIVEQIINNNCYDYIFEAAFGTSKTDSYGGVDFVWDGNSVKIDGTASGAQSSNCIVSPSSLLGMEKGKTYRFVNNCSDSRVAFTLFVTTDNGSNWSRVEYIYGNEYDYTIPNNITGFLFRVDVGNGDTLDCTATLHAYNTLTNDEIKSILKRALLSEALDLPNNTDWHTIKTNSVWFVDGSKTYTNAPPLSSKTGFLFSFNVANGAWYLHLFIPFSVVGIYRERGDDSSWSEWADIASSGTATYNNYYTFNNYTNENTISCSPSFTTDTNAYLAPSGSSDRTADILSVLTNNGICRLGKGIYYITDLVMPDDTTIEGCGDRTLIMLTENANFGIKMGSNCILEKFNMVGKPATITPQSTVRSKHGILWQGDYTQSESSLTQPKRSIIDKVFLAHFEGGAITCYDTGYGTYNHLEVTNCYIWNCDAGINVSYFSEFHKFTNVRANECYYGCVNNGGNNVFVNCDFSTNKVGFLMDNSTAQSPNNSHGSAVACVFNHTDSNAGIGIKVLNCDNGFIFDGCQIFFSQIYADDSEGLVFSNCNFGSDNIVLTISGGGAILFANNMHQGTPTINITNNDKVHFANCYNRSSGAVISN